MDSHMTIKENFIKTICSKLENSIKAVEQNITSEGKDVFITEDGIYISYDKRIPKGIPVIVITNEFNIDRLTITCCIDQIDIALKVARLIIGSMESHYNAIDRLMKDINDLSNKYKKK